MKTELTTLGGCLCGRLRYGLRGRPIDAGYCHCRICQRSSGAPAVAWVSFPAEAFQWTQGRPAVHRSSPSAGREFCARCGTQMVFRLDGSGTVDVNVASLDEPAAFPPEYHIWTASRIPWFQTADDLPRYEDDGPERRAP